MNNSRIVASRMETIQRTFQQAEQLAVEDQNDEALLPHLEKFEPQFRSVSFEAAAFVRASQDLEEDTSLKKWSAFMQRTQAHEIQVHIGLGWALAKNQLAVQPFLGRVSSTMHTRVIDGYGYYDGYFRKRNTVVKKNLPALIDALLLPAYDQGVGRCLWYIAQGDLQQLLTLIKRFSDNRQADLWRGVGIAVTYVGGCDEATLQLLFASADAHQSQLACGAALAARSRIQADTLNEDAALACRVWHTEQ